MRYLLLSLIFVASFCRADNFTPIPSKIIGPGGSKISIEGGNATIQPSSGGSVNVVTGAVYVPTVLDFSTSVSPLVSASGHSSLSYNGTGMLVSVNGGAYSAFGVSAWGGITGTLSSQSDLNTALGLKAPLISPSFTTPILGTPTSGTLTNCTGLPTAGVTGLGTLATVTPGTGIATALTINTGSAGAPVLFNGAGGTPSSLTLTNATGLPAAGVTGTAVTQTTLSNATLPASFTTLASTGASSFATAGGNIAIGNATPSYLLHARKDVAGSADIVVENATSTGQATLRARNNSGVDFQAGVAGSSYSTYQNLVANSVFFYTAATGGMGFNIDNASAGFSFWSNGAARVTISNAGVLGVSGSVSSSGDLICSTAGKGIQLKSGTGARAGNATLVGGTVTVPNTTVTANTVVIPSRKTPGGTLGNSLSYSVSAGTSFTITSVDATGVLSALDTSVCSFLLIELN